MNIESFYYFYLVLGIIALVATFLDHFGTVKEDDKKTTITTHSIKRR